MLPRSQNDLMPSPQNIWKKLQAVGGTILPWYYAKGEADFMMGKRHLTFQALLMHLNALITAFKYEDNFMPIVCSTTWSTPVIALY